jgi:hypothetical protein
MSKYEPKPVSHSEVEHLIKIRGRGIEKIQSAYTARGAHIIKTGSKWVYSGGRFKNNYELDTTVKRSKLLIHSTWELHKILPFEISFKDCDDRIISAKMQAQEIIKFITEKIKDNPTTKIGITYSANNDQAEGLYAGYAKKKQYIIHGANQAAVFNKVTETIKTNGWQNQVRILPIPTCKHEGCVGGISTMTSVRKAMKNITTHAEEGWYVLGLRNQLTKKYDFAIGGGVSAKVWNQSPQQIFVTAHLKKMAKGLMPYIVDAKHPKLAFYSKIPHENLVSLKTVYNKGYAFPTWTLTTPYQDIGKSAKLFYTLGPSQAEVSLEVVKRMATEREPVNIGMKRLYDPCRLKKLFGWKTSAYSRYFKKHQTLGPNIAIYTPSIVEEDISQIVHVLNVIGYAFDSPKQPDFQYFSSRGFKGVLEAYTQLFRLVFTVAQNLKLKCVVMSLVGGNNFSKLYPGGISKFQTSVWLPSFLNALKNSKFDNSNVFFMGTKNSPIHTKLQKLKFVDLGYWPTNIQLTDVKKTLFVNAWDPHSIPGNGNFQDNSLDGYIGRTSTIASVGWPASNVYLQDTLKYTRVN